MKTVVCKVPGGRDESVEKGLLVEIVEGSVTSEKWVIAGGTVVSVETELLKKTIYSSVKNDVSAVEVAGVPGFRLGFLGEAVDASVRAVRSEVSEGTTVSEETELFVEVVDFSVTSGGLVSVD